MKTLMLEGNLLAGMNESMQWQCKDELTRRVLQALTDSFCGEVSPSQGNPRAVVFDRVALLVQAEIVDSERGKQPLIVSKFETVY